MEARDVKIALIGGTGSFGRRWPSACARPGYEVVIGSRDAERARAAAAELGRRGRDERGCRPRRRPRRPRRRRPTARRDRPLAPRGDRHDARALRRGRALVHEGGRPADDRGDLDRRADPGRCSTRPVVAGLHSLAASNLGGEEAPDEDTLVCGDDAEAKAIVLELAGKAHVRPRDRRRPARERARARGHDRRDREREQALQGARRPARHRRPLT